MSRHPSFKPPGGLSKKRNVLKRFERVELLKKRGQWKEGDRVVSLVKTKPEEPRSRHEVKRTVEEEDQGDVILRRTVIDEVELKDTSKQEPPRHADE